uniref:Nuclear receptor domain-containing protein n=1 Tax=Ditylenchus dipsaci TaxID=166011 RepID=A0A915DTL1_9BILA
MSPQTPNFDCLLPEPLGNSYTLVPVKDDPYAISIPSPPSPDVQSQLLPIDQIKEEFVTKVTKKNCQSHPYGRPCNRTKLAFGSTFCLVCGDLAVNKHLVVLVAMLVPPFSDELFLAKRHTSVRRKKVACCKELNHDICASSAGFKNASNQA